MSHLSLFELNQLVKQTLDANLSPSYWVVAEISELRTNQKGHCYLELVEKEDDRIVAKSRATIWAYTYRNLSVWFEGMTGKSLQPGLKILCNLSVQFHEMYGLSYNIKDIDANFTIGERARKRKEIIDQLHSDGVFDMNKGYALPLVPQNIAVISSPTAAGFGDFINQLEGNRFNYNFNIDLFKTTMQGDGAPASIIDSLLQIHGSITNYDLVCIIRGGGSQLDLDCFDNYEVASHVAQFPLPIITGIGHERDESITDLVANTKLKTPTAVAEFLIEGFRSFEERLENDFSIIFQHVQNKINLEDQRLSNILHRLRSTAKESIIVKQNKLSSIVAQLKSSSKSSLKQSNNMLDGLDKHLKLINPITLLERGYSISLKDGKSINKVKLSEGDEIETFTSSYKIKSTINQLKTRNE